MKFEIHYVKEISSTNSVLKSMISSGIPEGYVIAADHQTDGRGRFGRTFYSPSGGLYFSVLLKPEKEIKPALITCLSAAALAETISSYGIKCGIKWVNDIYCGSKKAAGILTEGSYDSNGKMKYAVVGIGLNLYMPETVPDELKNIMTGIFKSKKDAVPALEILNCILTRIDYYYEQLPKQSFENIYRKYFNCRGRKISFLDGNKETTGTAVDIDSDFRLIVRTESETVHLERGEVNFIN